MDVALLPQSAPVSAAPPVDVALLQLPRRRLRVQVVIAVPRISVALLVYPAAPVGATHRPDVAAAARRNAAPQAARHVPVGAVPPMDAAVAVRGVALPARWRLPMVHAAALLRNVAVRRPPPVAAEAAEAADRCPLVGAVVDVVAAGAVATAANRAMVALADPPRILLPNSNTIPWSFRPILEHQAPILR